MPTVQDFIDRGDDCSDSGTPSSIGEYDNCDSFIDDEEYEDEYIENPPEPIGCTCDTWYDEPNCVDCKFENYKQHQAQLNCPDRQQELLEDASRHSSPLFVSSQRAVSELSDVVQPVRGTRLPLHNVRESTEPWVNTSANRRGRGGLKPGRVGLRHGRIELRSISRVSPQSVSTRGRRRSRSPDRRRRSASSHTLGRSRSQSAVTNSRNADSPGRNRVQRQVRAVSCTPDPQHFPDHLRKEDLKGTGVPGKRLGSGRSRWASRFMLLTYPQCGYEWPYQQLVELSEPLDFQYHISRELHEDGGYHFHALLDFRRKFETENVHRFCVGHARSTSIRTCPGQAHCNILPVTRTPFNAWDYVGKYGDIVASNLDRPPARGPNTTRDDLWTGSLALPTKDAFLTDVKKHSPRDFCLYPSSIKMSANIIYGVDKNPPDMPNLDTRGLTIHWERYPSVRQWVLESLPNGIDKIRATAQGSSYPQEAEAVDRLLVAASPEDYPRTHRPKSLIIFGATRLGKSDFATSLGPHVHFRGSFNLEDMQDMDIDKIEYAIWDDIGWKDNALKDERYKNWLGSQDDFTCTDRYSHKCRLKWNRPSIYLANKNPFIGLDPQDVSWLEENCVIVHLGDDVEPDRRNALCSETKGR